MTSELDWDHYRVFLAVLRAGSLSGAARDLGLVQPTVRKRIEALEAAVGALFVRTPAGLLPTEAARRLEAHVADMESAAAAFVREASTTAGEVAGTVRISASEVIAVEVLPAILRPLMEAHAGLSLILSPTNRNEDVLRREADVAVRMVPPTQGALRAQRIGAIPIAFHARRDYLAAHGVPDSIEALRHGHRVIGPEHEGAVVRAMRDAGIPIGDERFALRSDSDLAHVAAVRAGLGIGMCQLPLAARDPALVRVLPEIAFPLETFVVMHEDLANVAAVRAVFDALVAGLQAYLAQPSAAASTAVAAPVSA